MSHPCCSTSSSCATLTPQTVADDPVPDGSVLAQIDSLLQELDSVRPSPYKSTPKSPPPTPSRPAKPKPPPVAAKPSTSAAAMPAIAVPPPQVPSVKTRTPRPTVPPKPPLDTLRFSMCNMEDSPDSDIDALLNELSVLETQLQSMGPIESNPFMDKSPTKPQPIGVHPTTTPVSLAMPPPSQPPPQTLTTAASSSGSSSTGARTNSPDADSAFGDAMSLMSSESAGVLAHAQLANHGSASAGSRDTLHQTQPPSAPRSRDSNLSSSNESSHGSVNTPSPTQNVESVVITNHQQQQHCLRTVNEEITNEKEPNTVETEEQAAARAKSEKIKLALEKMKEASIKKLYVKFFTSDGASKSLLVDERSTVAYVLRQLAEKHRVSGCHNYAIVEHYPDLYMERIYEDHEHPVENILLWTRDSPNKLLFVQRIDKYVLFEQPQRYLLAESSNERNANRPMDASRKQQLIEEFFGPSHVQPPETEGWLHLKADGKKSWKKHYFVLRASGLYYIPKGKTKSSKDLVCLMNLEMIQVYTGFGWKKKYKSPTDHGFALKHPAIQVKASKYIKYLCCDDADTLDRWMMGLRVAKSGRQLYENYEAQRLSTELTVDADASNATRSNDNTASTTPSMRSSASAENCYNNNVNGHANLNGMQQSPAGSLDANAAHQRETVVHRPRTSGDSQGSVEVKLRPRSADIQRGGTKRNSRSLMQVELPTIPDEMPAGCEASNPGGSFCSPRHRSTDQPPPQPASIYGFPASPAQMQNGGVRHSPEVLPIGTVTTSVTAFNMNGHATDVTDTIKRAPCDVARRLAPNTQQPASARRHSSEQSSHGQGSCASSEKDVGGEVDSDEEDFPPPPSPHELAMASSPVMPPTGMSTPCLPVYQQQQHQYTVTQMYQPNSPLHHSPGMHNGYTPVVQQCASPGRLPHAASAGMLQKKNPPPPPKRSAQTQLTSTPSRSSMNGHAPPPPPLMSASTPQRPIKQDGPDFQSELQAAMQRRLRKIEQQIEG